MIIGWDTRQENILIFGMQGTGKTKITRKILDTIPNSPRLIISPQKSRELYGQYGNEINSVKQITNGGTFLWVGAKPDEFTFNAICKKVMTLHNMVLVVDDAHEFCKKQKMPKEWDTLINSGRNRGITSINISPSPNLLNNIIIQSSQHLISFRFALESQIEYAKKNFFGDIAYLLLFRPARPMTYQRYSQLLKHDYLHRFIEDDYVSLHSDNIPTKQLHSISDMTKETIEEPQQEETIEEPQQETIEESQEQDEPLQQEEPNEDEVNNDKQ